MKTKHFICGCGNRWLWSVEGLKPGNYVSDPCKASMFARVTCNNVYVYDHNLKLIAVNQYENSKT